MTSNTSSDQRPGPAAAALRVGIVGCGRVTETCHLPAIRGLSGLIDVVAVADVDAHRRQRVAGMFGIGGAYEGIDAMLRGAGGRIDAVAVCNPATAHAETVAAALRAGKHVLLEKPVALSLDDADRISDAAARAPDRRVMLAFNLRHHRLIRQAKAMLDAGAVGDVQLVRTLWTSGIRYRGELPAWRNRRGTGGGVLFEIAVHHVDLVRYLTGAEVVEVFAHSTHGEGDDETAALTMRLSSGATVSCVFSERAGDANELELCGPRGRLGFSIYRFDSLTLTPTGSYGAGLGASLRPFKELPAYWPILRRGGDFKETYRREWSAFADAVRGAAPVTATVHDGCAALRVLLAAAASANAAKPVAVADAPGIPQPVPDRPAHSVPVSSTKADTSGRPHLTAILATCHGFDTIRRTVRYLRAQTVRDRIELLIVCPNERELGLDPADVHGFWRHRVIEVGPIESAARANAAGVRAASAEVVALCEDHAFPDPGWAEALLVAHRGGPYVAVGPAVRNANPATLVSWADCLIGYGPWLEPVRAGEPAHLPGHNSSYKRDVLLRTYGEHLEEMMEAETVMQWDLRAKGYRLYLEPAARLAHTNFALPGMWTKVQFHAGRMFAATRALGWPWWKRAAWTCASPLIPLVRLKRVWGQAWRVGSGQRGLLLRVIPVLLWGLALDGLGQMFGYATGAGRSKTKVAHYEYDRVRFITERDRADLAAREPVAVAAAGPTSSSESSSSSSVAAAASQPVAGNP